MSDFKHKIERWHRMQELTEQAQEAMQGALLPLLKVYNSSGIGVVEKVGQGWRPGHVTVQHVDYRSGGPYTHEINIPDAVWYAADPVAAAHADVAKRQQAEADAERQKKVAEIARLARELAESAQPGEGVDRG